MFYNFHQVASNYNKIAMYSYGILVCTPKFHNFEALPGLISKPTLNVFQLSSFSQEEIKSIRRLNNINLFIKIGLLLFFFLGALHFMFSLYIIIRYNRFPMREYGYIFMLKNISMNQRLSCKVSFSDKKRVKSIWQICFKAVLLHPLSREKCR